MSVGARMLSLFRRPPKATDWNQCADFFNFTRGRFVCQETEQMAERHVRFNMNALCKVAGATVGRTCIHAEKCADGMYNKAFILTMDNNVQVIAKVPNPNAGRAHFTTASEVATMEFMRTVLNTPAPRVLAWSSSNENTVNAEYIIMEKAPGVQLQQVWPNLDMSERIKVIRALARCQRAWDQVSFPRIGSLYHAESLEAADNAGPTYFDKDGNAIVDSRYSIGPITGREWTDSGRMNLECDRGPWTTTESYRVAMMNRELLAIRTMHPWPKPIVMLCGPNLYQPSQAKKIKAGELFLGALPALLPKYQWASTFHLWHDDLHAENIFVDTDNPTVLTAIIDWQSSNIAPLFDHKILPSYLGHDGPPVEGMEKPSFPELANDASVEEKNLAEVNHIKRLLEFGFKQLLQDQIPAMFEALMHKETAEYQALLSARRIYDLSEIQLLMNLAAFPDLVKFSATDLAEIDKDADLTARSLHIMNVIEKHLEDLFPDKGVISHDLYEDSKSALRNAKRQVIDEFSKTPEEREAWKNAWPFDD